MLRQGECEDTVAVLHDHLASVRAEWSAGEKADDVSGEESASDVELTGSEDEE